MESQQQTFYVKYESPIFSADNVKIFLSNTIAKLELELKKVEDWKIEDPDELHHIHIKDANLHRINSELTIAKRLYCMASSLNYSNVDKQALELEYHKCSNTD